MSLLNKKVPCTYCEDDATTKDDVPPKSLFAKPRIGLIKVPACRACNQGASLDDEYFRLALIADEHAAEHPVAQTMRATVRRSLQRPSARGLRTAFQSAMRRVEVHTPAGLYIGTAEQLLINRQRLIRVIERTTRGLFLHHVKRRLPLSCEVNAFASRGMSHEQADVVLDCIRSMPASQIHSIGNDAFSYRFAVANDQINSSFWVFVVYGAFSFAAFTVDRGEEVGASAVNANQHCITRVS